MNCTDYIDDDRDVIIRKGERMTRLPERELKLGWWYRGSYRSACKIAIWDGEIFVTLKVARGTDSVKTIHYWSDESGGFEPVTELFEQ